MAIINRKSLPTWAGVAICCLGLVIVFAGRWLRWSPSTAALEPRVIPSGPGKHRLIFDGYSIVIPDTWTVANVGNSDSAMGQHIDVFNGSGEIKIYARRVVGATTQSEERRSAKQLADAMRPDGATQVASSFSGMPSIEMASEATSSKRLGHLEPGLQQKEIITVVAWASYIMWVDTAYPVNNPATGQDVDEILSSFSTCWTL